MIQRTSFEAAFNEVQHLRNDPSYGDKLGSFVQELLDERDAKLSDAQKTIEQLREENTVLKSQVDNADVNWQQQKMCADQLRTQNEQLQRELEAAREDVERMEWIEEASKNPDGHVVKLATFSNGHVDLTAHGIHYHSQDSLRTAIDAARATETKG